MRPTRTRTAISRSNLRPPGWLVVLVLQVIVGPLVVQVTVGLPGHLDPSGETGERGNGTDDWTRPDEEVHGTGGGGTAEHSEELK